MVRLSLAEARRLGILPLKEEKDKYALSSSPASPSSVLSLTPAKNPQRMIYDALLKRLGPYEVIFEATGLIPKRRFRADVYLPSSRIAVEMDGFQFHRSKTAFQKDRERQNLFVLNGIMVLRYFPRQVFRDLYGIIDQVLEAHYSRVQDQ